MSNVFFITLKIVFRAHDSAHTLVLDGEGKDGNLSSKDESMRGYVTKWEKHAILFMVARELQRPSSLTQGMLTLGKPEKQFEITLISIFPLRYCDSTLSSKHDKNFLLIRDEDALCNHIP